MHIGKICPLHFAWPPHPPTPHDPRPLSFVLGRSATSISTNTTPSQQRFKITIRSPEQQGVGDAVALRAAAQVGSKRWWRAGTP